MKANEMRVEDFIAQNRVQFIIPVYQRNYDWAASQCKQLLDDILQVGTNRKQSAHFIGSIVFVHDDIYTSSRIKELTIIDGQQRLTTLTLIYLVLYRLAVELKDQSLMSEINETYLINKFAPEEEKLKLRPTENNDKVLKHLLRHAPHEEYNGFSKLMDNFNYFRSRISLENYKTVLDGLSKLVFVEISLERDKDDPQRIFESLNSTGLDLSQADLIRNYILMGLNRRDQIRIYNSYWDVIERLAKDEATNTSMVSEFIRDFLTIENRNIPNKGKVYLEFKTKYPTSSVEVMEKNLESMKLLVKHYNKLANPRNERDGDISLQLEYINRIGINVAYPFIMKVYHDYSNDVIDKPVFIEILNLIQSFSWRRWIVGLPTNALNKIFMNLYEKVDNKNYLFSIQRALLQKKGVQRFPRDKEVAEALKTKDVYNIKTKNRMYFLERLENYENREFVQIEGNPAITVEHIFPQNPDPKWKIALGDEQYNFIKENYLNTISNLTLSGNNGKLGNKTFSYKRDLVDAGYKDSRLWLNKYLSDVDRWDRETVEARFNLIFDRFLKIWEFPAIDFESNDLEDEVNIFDADDPRHKKLDYAVFFNQKLEVREVSKLYVEVLKQLFELNPETFFITDLSEKINLTKNDKGSLLRQAVPLSDIYLIESNIDNVGKFERLKYALSVFGFEDELFVKYADKT
jgi:uncharacterized protein with ParB-like and HNH nuclease domain